MTPKIPTYCERSYAGSFGEPLNLITSLLFLIAAYIAFKQTAKVSQGSRFWLQAGTLFIGIIGVGSIAFHAAPSNITLLFDAVPIYIFLLIVLSVLLLDLTGSNVITSTAIALYVVCLIIVTLFVPSDFLNGSSRHALTFMFLLLILFLSFMKYRIHVLGLVGAILLYAMAIVFRSIDYYVCNDLAVGTHFLWHVLNATAAFLAIRFLVRIDMLKNI